MSNTYNNRFTSILKNSIQGSLMLTLLLLFVTLDTKAQQNNSSQISTLALPEQSGEHIKLYTDRYLYIVNDRIYFIAAYACCEEMQKNGWSKVLYLELIRWNGSKIKQIKVPLNRDGASGYLVIPKDLLSGNYYLRAYTKWMRNYSVYDYGYTLLKIVNPYKAETEISLEENQTDSIFSIIPEKLVVKPDILHCSVNKNSYTAREKVKLEIRYPGDKILPDNNFYITVTKYHSTDSISLISKVKNMQRDRSYKPEYLPELRGMTISGKVVERNTNKPLKGTMVYISIPITGEYLASYKTNTEGKFYFSLPDLTGRYDFYVDILQDNLETKIYLDNDFCDKPVVLPYIPFLINVKEKELLREMSIHTQISEKYEIMGDEEQPNENQYFYGKAGKVYYTKEYIELPNLKEFFFELVPEVWVHYKKAKPYLFIDGETGISIENPLILIDNIPASNDEKVLKIPVKKIERIEVINQPYVVSGNIYRGLISIYSVQKDFAGIDLSKNSMFFSFNLFEEFNYDFPDYADSSAVDSRIPDLRNLLYWEPGLQLMPGESKTMEFFTSDVKGNYTVYIHTKNGTADYDVVGVCQYKVE